MNFQRALFAIEPGNFSFVQWDVLDSEVQRPISMSEILESQNSRDIIGPRPDIVTRGALGVPSLTLSQKSDFWRWSHSLKKSPLKQFFANNLIFQRYLQSCIQSRTPRWLINVSANNCPTILLTNIPLSKTVCKRFKFSNTNLFRWSTFTSAIWHNICMLVNRIQNFKIRIKHLISYNVTQ